MKIDSSPSTPPIYPLPPKMLLCRSFHHSPVLRAAGQPSPLNNTNQTTKATLNSQNNKTIPNKNNINNNDNNKDTYNSEKNKRPSILDRIAEMERMSTPDGGFEIVTPKIFPPRPKHKPGNRQ